MHIILFNGPPGVGKDTAVNYLQGKLPGACHLKFSGPLKRAVTSLFLSGDVGLFNELDKPENKDKPHPRLFGHTLREAQIYLSEKHMKPLYGKHVFGELLENDIKSLVQEGEDIFLISDSGFETEASRLINTFGASQVSLVRLHREGKDFRNDSRGYIDLDRYGVTCFDVNNPEGDQIQFFADLDFVINQLIGSN